MPRERESRFEDVLAAAARLQEIVPDAVLVGGTAAAHHARHRVSFDDDHVLADLQERFDEVLEALEETEGWVTSRVRGPVLILGSLDGVETGIRQLIRRRPLEVEEIEIPASRRVPDPEQTGGTRPRGRRVRVPTLAEIFRIKAWLVLRRNATRDTIDVVALAERLGEDAAAVALTMDDCYEDQTGPGGRRIATQLAKHLADPAPYDFSEVDLPRYRNLSPRWHDWERVIGASRGLAAAILEMAAEGGG